MTKIIWDNFGKNGVVQPVIDNSVCCGYTSANGDDQHNSKINYDTATFTDLGLGSYKARTDTALKHNNSIFYTGNVLSYLDEYNIETLTKYSKTPPTDVMDLQSGFENDTDGYMFVGRNASAIIVNLNRKYNFLLNSWTNVTSYSESIYAPGCFTFRDTSSCIVDGRGSDTITTHNHYTFSSDSYDSKTNYPQSLYGIDIFQISESTYHGVGGNTAIGYRQKYVYEYNIAANTWGADTDLTIERSFGASSSDTLNATGYQYGGSITGGAAQSTILKFLNSTWSTFTNMTTARRDFGAVSI